MLAMTANTATAIATGLRRVSLGIGFPQWTQYAASMLLAVPQFAHVAIRCHAPRSLRIISIFEAEGGMGKSCSMNLAQCRAFDSDDAEPPWLKNLPYGIATLYQFASTGVVTCA
jgi:hypothetical protein